MPEAARLKIIDLGYETQDAFNSIRGWNQAWRLSGSLWPANYAKKTLQGRPYILAATWPSPPAQARPPHTQNPKANMFGSCILDFGCCFFLVLDLGFGILDRLSFRSVCSGPKRGCLDFGVWICRANSGRRINACSMKTFCPVAVLCKYRGVWFKVASFPYWASAQYPPK